MADQITEDTKTTPRELKVEADKFFKQLDEYDKAVDILNNLNIDTSDIKSMIKTARKVQAVSAEIDKIK